jgi:hypothetical protein
MNISNTIKKTLISLGLIASISAVTIPAFERPLTNKEMLTVQEYMRVVEIYSKELEKGNTLYDINTERTILSVLSDKILEKDDINKEDRKLVKKTKRNEELTLSKKKTNLVNKIIKEIQ